MITKTQSKKEMETRAGARVPVLRFPEFSGPARHTSRGDVGGEWGEKRLDQIATINPRSDSLPEEFYYVDLESVENGILKSRKKLKKESAPSRAQRVLEKMDVLFQTVRPYQKNNLFFNEDGKYVASTGYAQIRNKESAEYIYQSLHFGKFVNKVLARCIGTSYPAINSNDLAGIKIFVPSLPEQKKIAGVLGVVDEKIEGLTKKKKSLEWYKKGVMQKIFSQEIRFRDENGNPYPDWEEKKLEELCKIKTGKKDVNAGNPKGRYRFYTCAKDFTYSNNYSFEGESIMIAGNAEVGLCQYYDGKFEAYQRTYVLQNFSILGSYLFRYLSTYFRQYALGLKQTGAMSFIKIGMLDNFIVPVPSLPEQKKIAAFLTSLDEKISAIATELSCAKEFKKGLLQQMFV